MPYISTSDSKRELFWIKRLEGDNFERREGSHGFPVLQTFMQEFFEGGKDEYLFALVFLILVWNLIARSNNNVNLAIGDLEWSDDCLIAFFEKVKDRPRGCRCPHPFPCFL